jgi:hypothetical protein
VREIWRSNAGVALRDATGERYRVPQQHLIRASLREHRGDPEHIGEHRTGSPTYIR